MNSQKVFYGLIGMIVVLGLGIVASAYQANSLLESKSKTLVDLKAKKAAAANQEKQLIQAKKDIATYQELNAIAKTVVPQGKDQAETVRQIANLAAQSGIPKLSSISFTPSTLGAAIKGKSGKGLTQVTPVQGISGVFDLPITVTQSSSDLVPYNNFIAFLSKLENNRRTAQVTSINVQPDPKNPSLISFTLVIDEYIKPR